MSQACTLTVTADSVDGAAVLTPDGTLDSSTYRPLRDELVSAALDEPTAVIVDVGRLSVPADTAWLVFSSAWWYVDGWPNTPILIVCGCPQSRSALTRTGVANKVPVFPTVGAALATLGHQDAERRQVRAALRAEWSCLHRSREIVELWLTAWAQTELIPVTQVIVTALVENVLKHTDSDPDLRLESDGASVTVAVEDASRSLASMRESSTGACDTSGLRVVSALCRQWGNAPTSSGKTVWAMVGHENRI